MRLQFFQSQVLPFGVMVYFHYEKERDERYAVDVITKLHHDQPLSFIEVCAENMLVSLDISKDFDTELLAKNWLIDNQFLKMYGNDEYELYSKNLCYNSRYCNSDVNVNYKIPFYAVWRKRETPQQNIMRSVKDDIRGTELPSDIKEKFSNFVASQTDIPAEFAEIVNDNFWDLI